MVLTQPISLISIICMAVSGIILVGGPILFMIYVNSVFECGYGQILSGAISYMLIVMLFSNALARVMYLTVGAWATSTIYGKFFVSCLIPACVEVMGLAMILGRKKAHLVNFPNFLMFGIGFAVCENLMLGVTSLLNNLSFAWAYNMHGFAALVEGRSPETVDQIREYIQVLIDTFPLEFLLPAIEGTLYSVFRIGVVLIMLLMLQKKLPNSWIGLMIVMYLSLMIAAVVTSIGLIPDLALNISMIILLLVYNLILFLVLRRNAAADLNKLMGK